MVFIQCSVSYTYNNEYLIRIFLNFAVSSGNLISHCQDAFWGLGAVDNCQACTTLSILLYDLKLTPLLQRPSQATPGQASNSDGCSNTVPTDGFQHRQATSHPQVRNTFLTFSINCRSCRLRRSLEQVPWTGMTAVHRHLPSEA